MHCQFARAGDGWVCLSCGRRAAGESDTRPSRECRAGVSRPPRAPGLGDMVKAGLSAVGITEDRVSKAIGKPCGCGKRAATLNELGAKYLGLPPGSTG